MDFTAKTCTLLLLLVCVLTAAVSGGRVLYECNKFCAEKYAEEIKANNMQKNDDLVKKVILCAEACVDQLNEKLRNRGLEKFVEPNPHFKFED